jgi:hypothetical protein
MEKKLIYFNSQEFNRQQIVFLKNLEVLNQIGEKYSQLGIGKISPERVQEIISGNFNNIVGDVIDAVTKEAKNALLKNILQTASFERLENFQTDANSLVSKFNRNQHAALGIVSTPIEFFSIKNGKFQIIDATWEKVKENCSNYIENEQEQKVHDALQSLAAASNEFMSALGPNVKAQYFPPQEPSDFLILNDNGLFEPDPTTDFESLTQ